MSFTEIRGSAEPARASLLDRSARAIGAVWLLLALEFVVVVLLARREFASAWELESGLLWLAPTALFASAVSAVPAALVAALVEYGERLRPRALLALVALVFGAGVGWGVGGGRHLSSDALRGGFACLLGAACALGAYASSGPLARLLRARPSQLLAAILLAIAGLELANQLLLVRLYPAFHAGLALLALGLAPLALEAARRIWPEFRLQRAAWSRSLAMGICGVTAVAAVAAKPAAERLAHFDNFRLAFSERAPLLGKAVELAARIVPPAGPDDVSCDALPAAERAQSASCRAQAALSEGRSLDWRGRDFLLISVDALRADHVGNYGYARPTTPHLDELAKSSVVFDAAYAPTPHTSYSVTSLMTGKYMRPLLLQGAARDSDTWASLSRTYGYRTAAFYPPAVFFIDPDRFESFRDSGLGFEYRWVEFAEGERRIAQVRDYLAQDKRDKPLFLWMHLFAPHEPYEAHAEFPFGDRDIDRYDSEIRASDQTLGAVIQMFRAQRPQGVVIVTADHGEEFGDHGGRYHGSSVYDEQVRVPLLISAPGLLPPRRIAEPVQTIDLLPTVLAALDIPRPPRIRGRDLGPLLAGLRAPGPGLALAETEEQTLLAEGPLRLICARKLGACKLFDVSTDAAEKRDISSDRAKEFGDLRARLRELSNTHGRFEQTGLRAEGKGWPAPILRGLSGDGDAAEEIAALLDDADLAIRRKAAELLFELKRPEARGALRLAVARDEDEEVRRRAALALTRLGEGAPLTFELAQSGDLPLRRLAALALAENADSRGEKTLITWWQDAGSRDFNRSREIAAALGNVRSKDAVWTLTQALDDVRLRPYVAESLAHIGGDYARSSLLRAFSEERSQSTRVTLLKALVDMGAGEALALPLARFMGVPDPIPNGLEAAVRAKILERVGGPGGTDLGRLRAQSALGVALTLIIPSGGNGRGVRAFFRARAVGDAPGELLLGAGPPEIGGEKRAPRLPDLNPARALRVQIPNASEPVLVYADVPASVGARAGLRARFVVFADSSVRVDSLALVPLADELPPPKPVPWQPPAGQGKGPAAGLE